MKCSFLIQNEGVDLIHTRRKELKEETVEKYTEMYSSRHWLVLEQHQTSQEFRMEMSVWFEYKLWVQKKRVEILQQ